jgi:DNA-binding protein HU-beta
MTKAELISLIAKSTGVERAEVSHIVASFTNIIKRSLDEGEEVHIRGFGSFIIKRRAEKKARNISKNTAITIPERNVPIFRPSKIFLDMVAIEKKKTKRKK